MPSTKIFIILLVSLSTSILAGGILQQDVKEKKTIRKEDLLCTACTVTLGAFIFNRRVLKFDDDKMKNSFDLMCKTVVSQIYDTEICLDLVEEHLELALFLMDNKPNVKGSDVCAMFLHNINCKSLRSPKWEISIQDGTPATKKVGNPNAEPLKILQVTDIHYDPLYQEGALAECRRPLCCQADSGDVEKPADAAGKWSDYRDCDIPASLVSETFKHIQKTNKFDYIYFTGDIISHRVWETSIANNKRDMKLIMNMFKENFGNVKVFPILGNHEPHPLNLYAPDELKNTSFSTQWLFDFSADLWSNWLPEETISTIKRGGYYTVLVKPGFRLIALNSNVAYTLNAWLLYDDKDPYGQLQWFADTLQKAEEANEVVHVLSHLPSGDEYTYSPWGEQFTKIVHRYANTIAAVFNGHTHFDEFSVYHDGEKATNVAYNGGSLTPYSDVNPNYRIYDVDSKNFEILDYTEYIFNLTESNLSDKSPKWFKLYSFKEEYGVKSMRPNEIYNLTQRMSKDSTLRNKYFQNKIRLGDTGLEKGCDKSCHETNLCNMVTVVHSDRTLCKKLVKEMSKN